MSEYKCKVCKDSCEVVVSKGQMDYTDLCVVTGELGEAKFKKVR